MHWVENNCFVTQFQLSFRFLRPFLLYFCALTVLLLSEKQVEHGLISHYGKILIHEKADITKLLNKYEGNFYKRL